MIWWRIASGIKRYSRRRRRPSKKEYIRRIELQIESTVPLSPRNPRIVDSQPPTLGVLHRQYFEGLVPTLDLAKKSIFPQSWDFLIVLPFPRNWGVLWLQPLFLSPTLGPVACLWCIISKWPWLQLGLLDSSLTSEPFGALPQLFPLLDLVRLRSLLLFLLAGDEDVVLVREPEYVNGIAARSLYKLSGEWASPYTRQFARSLDI